MSERPLVGITLGDPASVGPEIVLRALAAPGLHDVCRPLVVGDGVAVARALASTGVPLAVHVVDGPAAGRYTPGVVDLMDLAAVDAATLVWGRVQAQAGRAAFGFIVRAIELALAGEVDAVATGPINKEALRAAGVPYIGHTEIFGALTGTRDPLTMFETRGLRIFFLTRHVSLAGAVRLVTSERTRETLHGCDEALRRLGIARPRLAVAALNPHGGEHGLFGDEEERELRPAVEAARAAGLDVTGPLPADSVFWQAAHGAYDAVLSLYHDQGHIAAKMFDFERTVSITAGLPFLRTSVDHGTAFDIAGKGTASSVSMEEAIRAAARYARAFRPSVVKGDRGEELRA